MLKEINLYKIHVFQYSKRQGTKAAIIKGQISPEIKEERSKRLIKLSNIVGEDIRNTFIGKKVEVLIEEKQNRILDGTY